MFFWCLPIFRDSCYLSMMSSCADRNLSLRDIIIHSSGTLRDCHLQPHWLTDHPTVCQESWEDQAGQISDGSPGLDMIFSQCWAQIFMFTGLISPVLLSFTHCSLSLTGSTNCKSWSTGSSVWWKGRPSHLTSHSMFSHYDNVAPSSGS